MCKRHSYLAHQHSINWSTVCGSDHLPLWIHSRRLWNNYRGLNIVHLSAKCCIFSEAFWTLRRRNHEWLQRVSSLNWSIKTKPLTYNALIMTILLKPIIILFFVTIFLDTVGGSFSSKLYPFGKDFGDLHLPVKDDVSSNAISTPPFWFFGLNVSTLYVSISCENNL